MEEVLQRIGHEGDVLGGCAGRRVRREGDRDLGRHVVERKPELRHGGERAAVMRGQPVRREARVVLRGPVYGRSVASSRTLPGPSAATRYSTIWG